MSSRRSARTWRTATAGGLARLLGLGVAIGAGVLLATYALRRRRRAPASKPDGNRDGDWTETGTDYTPEP